MSTPHPYTHSNPYGTDLPPGVIAAVEAAQTDEKPRPEPTCLIPPSTFLLSLNGYDEIAIANHFGAKITDLREDPITGGRAMAFVHQRRKGAKDADAYIAAMLLSMQNVMDYFASEPKADDPVSAEEKAPAPPLTM